MTTEIVPVVKENASWGKGRIKLIGVGTAGIQVVNSIFKDLPQSVMAISCDTDAEALNGVANIHKVLLGESILNGRGCMGDPEKGMAAAKESIEELRKLVGQDTEMVFFIAGVGKGTGSGSLPLIAEELLQNHTNVSSIAILLYPFSPSGKRVRQIADKSIEEIKKHVSAVIVIDNDNIAIAEKRIEDIWKERNNFIKSIIQGIIYSCNPGLYFSIKPGELGMLFGQGKEAHVGISIQSKIDKPDLDEMFEQISSHPYLKHILTLKNADALFVSFLWHPSVDVTGNIIHSLKRRLEKESPKAEFLFAMGSASHLPEKSAMLLIMEAVDSINNNNDKKGEEELLWQVGNDSNVNSDAHSIETDVDPNYATTSVGHSDGVFYPSVPAKDKQTSESENLSPEELKRIKKQQPAYIRKQRKIPGLISQNTNNYYDDDGDNYREVPNPKEETIPFWKNKPD